MNYKRHYDQLILRAQKRTKPAQYCERHHILPLCMGGSNASTNLVYLTAEEHYIAHQLLIRIHPDCQKLVFAAMGMCIDYHGNRKNNKIFGWLRRLAADAARGIHLGKPKPGVSKSNTLLKTGVPLSDAHKTKLSAALKGVPNLALRGQKHSAEHRLKNSLSQKGTCKPNCGGRGMPKPGTSAALKGRAKSLEHNAKNSASQRLRKEAADHFQVKYREVTNKQVAIYKENKNPF